MRKKLIAGNWKMHKNQEEMAHFFDAFDVTACPKEVDMVIFPPFTGLAMMARLCQNLPLSWGAQNMHESSKGAYTGEISASMLTDLGCRYVLLGHSERRLYFSETDACIARKVQQAHHTGLVPVICVGETLEQRQSGNAMHVVEEQVRTALSLFDARQECVVAYEPVWAIGTGQVATATQAQEMHVHIRHLIQDLAGEAVAHETRILYGGSVTCDTIGALMCKQDIDGALVGGASLDTVTFLKLASF